MVERQKIEMRIAAIQKEMVLRHVIQDRRYLHRRTAKYNAVHRRLRTAAKFGLQNSLEPDLGIVCPPWESRSHVVDWENGLLCEQYARHAGIADFGAKTSERFELAGGIIDWKYRSI